MNPTEKRPFNKYGELSIGNELCTRLEGQLTEEEDLFITRMTINQVQQLLLYAYDCWKKNVCPLHNSNIEETDESCNYFDDSIDHESCPTHR